MAKGVAQLRKETEKESGKPSFAFRNLSNPPRRMEISPDFPETLDMEYPPTILKVLEDELRKHGTSLKETKRITLAYPHKHPGLYPYHENLAARAVETFQKIMKTAAPHVQWIIAGGLCETVLLGRSENQDSVHTLTSRQVYEIHPPSQKEPCPFFDAKNKEKEFFIVVDWAISQGTTVASLMNYITHNNGVVLAAVVNRKEALAQSKACSTRVSLSKHFNNAARNCARLPEISKVFAASAKEEGFRWSPETCLKKFEKQLSRHGNSVFAMTNGECSRLIKNMTWDNMSFPALLRKLDKKTGRSLT